MDDQQMALVKRYADAERETRAAMGRVYNAIVKALALEAVMGQRVSGGDLADMADYHAANLAKLGGAEVSIRQLAGGLKATIEAVQLAGLAQGINIFPGVNVTLPAEGGDDER
jgi:hypothetical protein